jgi:hypothetical protein
MVDGEIEIEASSLEKAIVKFNQMAEHKSPTGHVPILDKATKLEPELETLEVNKDEAADINPPVKYKVYITRTETLEVEVEAGDENEAQDIASSMVSSGECEHDFEFEDIEITDVEEIEE